VVATQAQVPSSYGEMNRTHAETPVFSENHTLVELMPKRKSPMKNNIKKTKKSKSVFTNLTNVPNFGKCNILGR